MTYGIQGPDGDEVDQQGAGSSTSTTWTAGSCTASRIAGAQRPVGARAGAGRLGRFGGDLLVGNFGDGRIHASERPDGTSSTRHVRDADGSKLAIDGLWALEFGNSGNNGNAQTLYFTAGPNDENDGLFGTIAPAS